MGQDTTSNENFEPNLYMTPNMTLFKRIFILHCLMKQDDVESVFPFVKGENSERVQDMNQKLIKPRV